MNENIKISADSAHSIPGFHRDGMALASRYWWEMGKMSLIRYGGNTLKKADCIKTLTN